MAAYDPIFYLHHSNVDRQYAFWQELQKLRGLSTEAIDNLFEFPPFFDRQYNPSPTYQVTGVNATQSYGLDYESNFCYKYDQLLFDGKTPEEFLPECSNTSPIMAAITVKNDTKQTTNNIVIQQAAGTRQLTTLATISNAFVTLGIQGQTSEKPFYFDLTEEILGLSGVDPKNLDLVVASFDFEGNSIPANAFKPTLNYIAADRSQAIYIQVDYFDQYARVIDFCHLNSTVEFLNSDGSYSDQVKRKVDNSRETTNVTSPFTITTTKNEFILNDYQIDIGYDPFCHITVSRKQSSPLSLVEVQQGFPLIC